MNYHLSFQLYSARNFPPLEAQLKFLKKVGYDAVEPWLPAYGEDPKAFRRALDENGLACRGFHMPLAGLVSETDRFADIAGTLGSDLMIIPWIPPEERDTGPEGWKRLGSLLGEGAGKLKSRGLRVAWHNHDFEFAPLTDGSRAIDHIFAEAGPDLGLEIDCGWIERVGASPAAELARFAERIWAIQVKDMAPRGTEQDGGWAPVGDGIIDWAALWPSFLQTRADHLVVEHDHPSDFEALAERSFKHLDRLNQASKGE